MSDRNDGGSAFPGIEPSGDAAYGGMSLRDWFAGQAVGSVIAFVFPEASDANAQPPETARLVATISYRLADAMLAERAKSERA